MDADKDKTPDWVAEALACSEAQIESGQTVPIEPVLERLRASIVRMKAGRPRAELKAAREA